MSETEENLTPEEKPSSPASTLTDGQEKAPTGAEKNEGPGDARQQGTATVSNVSGEHNSVYGAILEQHNYYRSDSVDAGPGRLAFKHFDSISSARLEDLESGIVVEPQELETLKEAAKHHRLLFLEGPAEMGKGQIALKLAASLMRKDRLQHVLRPRILLHERLTVDLLELLENKACHESFVLFEGALRFANGSLLQLAKDTDVMALEALESRLRQVKSFLVLTYDTEQRPFFHDALKARIRVVVGPTRRQLESFLSRRARTQVEEVCREADLGTFEAKVEAFLAANRDRVVEKLATIPRIERFIAGNLMAVLEERVTLEAALEEADQLDNWLLEQRAVDQEELVCALALTLCHAGPKGRPVRWYSFERLRQEIETFLRHELNQQEEVRSPTSLCREGAILQKLQIEVEEEPAGDVVRFKDEKRAERLWGCLLANGRRLSSLLVPCLTRLAASDEPSLCRHAAWALGRLGKLELQSLFGRPFDLWAARLKKPGGESLAALGGLVQGAILGGDVHLRSYCLSRLRQYLQSSDYERVVAALRALGELGAVDLGAALETMRPALEAKLLPCLKRLEHLKRVPRRLSGQEVEIFERHNLRSSITSRYDRDLEEELFFNLPVIFKPESELGIFMAVQYSLLSLCSSLGPAAVLAELSAWMPAGQSRLAPLLALLFLHNFGMAEDLEQSKVALKNEKGREEWWSPILASISSDERLSERICLFLFEIYLGACQFPHVLEKALTWRFFALIEAWTRQAAEGKECRDLVVSLWLRLLRMPDSELRERLFGLLDHPSFGTLGTHLGGVVAQIRKFHERGEFGRGAPVADPA